MDMYGMHVMSVALVVVCARNWWLVRKYDRLRIAFRQRLKDHDAIVAWNEFHQDRDLQAPYMPRVPKVQTNKKKKKKQKVKQQSTAQ